MSNPAILKPASIAHRMADRFGVDPAEMIQTLKATAFRGQVSDAQMQALLIVAEQYGLNPWTKELYAFPDKNNGIVPVVGVDGWSRIINENSAFDGMDFQQDDESCTCIIYRKDRNHPIKVTEWMSECKREGVGPWKSHPKRMLRHKAMIQCARIAFGYTGIYDEDEAQRIVEKDVTPPAQDISPALQAIQNASSMDELQEAFKAAWTQHPDARMQLTAAKDERKKALLEPIEGEVVEPDNGSAQ